MPIANLGIAVNTAQVSAADLALDKLAQAATAATAALARMTAASGATGVQAGNAARQVNTLANAHNNAAKAVHGHTQGMMQSRMAMMEYEHSIRSIIDGLSAGMSPIRLFAMEGSRLAQAFQMGGGAAGALQMFGSIASKVLNPTVMLTAAVVGLGVGGAMAFNAWQASLNRLQVSLNTLGRSTGLTLGGLNQVAMSAAGGRITTGMAQQAVAGFAATGHISPLLMPQATALAQRYAETTGTSFAEAAQKLAPALAEPTKGAAELNKQFMFLGDNEQQLIEHMDAVGDRFGAQAKLLDDFANHIKGAADVTSIWATAWNAVASGASTAFSAAGGFIAPTPEMKLKTLTDRIQAGGGSATTGFAGFAGHGGAASTDILDQQTLQEMVDRRGNAAVLAAIEQTAREKSIDIGNISRGMLPDDVRRRALTEQRDKLQEAINTPGALGKTDPNMAAEALRRLNAELSHFATNAQRVTEDSQAEAAATVAQTAQQRTAIQALKAYNDVIRDTGNTALAAATATAKWNEAIAETQKRVDDDTRKVAQENRQVFLHGVDRTKQEILDRLEDTKRSSVYGQPLSALDLGMTALDTSSPFGTLDPATRSKMENIGTMQVQPGATGAWARAAGLAPPMPPVPQGWPAGRGAGVGGGYAPPVSTAGFLQTPITKQQQDEINANQRAGRAEAEIMADVLDREQKSLNASAAILKVQKETWGAMPGQIAEATEQVKLLNEANQHGVTITEGMRQVIKEQAAQAGAQAQDQASFQQLTSLMGNVQDMASSLTTGAASDLAMAFDKHIPIQQTIGQLPISEQMKYYTGKLSAQGARNALAKQQIGDLARQEMFKFGLGMVEKGIMGTDKQPGLITPLMKGGMSLLTNLLGSALGGFGGAPDFGGPPGVGTFGGDFSNPPIWTYSAGGNVMTPMGPMPLRRYAAGGVASSPQAAVFGEGSGSEAYVPLPDGRSIPVALKTASFGGGAHGTTNVRGGDVIVQGNADEKILPQVQAMLAENSKQMAKQMQRNAGPMNNKWSQRYG